MCKGVKRGSIGGGGQWVRDHFRYYQFAQKKSTNILIHFMQFLKTLCWLTNESFYSKPAIPTEAPGENLNFQKIS